MFFRVFVALTICLLFYFNYYKKRNARLPPGPIRLPILGSAIQLHRANSGYVHLALMELARKYGDIMSFGLGMQTAADTNSHRYEFPYVPDRNYGKNLVFLYGHGDTWFSLRSFTKKVLNRFGYNEPKIMNESLVDSANQLIDSIKIELLDSADGNFSVEQSKFSVNVINVMWNLLGASAYLLITYIIQTIHLEHL